MFNRTTTLQSEFGKVKMCIFPHSSSQTWLSVGPHKNPGSLINEILAFFVFPPLFNLASPTRLSAKFVGITDHKCGLIPHQLLCISRTLTVLNFSDFC